MARRRWYRRYPRVVAAKKKWASNFVTGEMSNTTSTAILCQNSGQNVTPTPVIIKTGNFKVQGDATLTNSGNAFRARIFIIFVPEGWSSGSYEAIPTQHPEWIMGWTQMDVQDGAVINKFSITTRLKRNLNSGDNIRLLVTYADIGITTAFTIHFTAQFFTCAN